MSASTIYGAGATNVIDKEDSSATETPSDDGDTRPSTPRVATCALRAADLVLLLNDICGPEYFEDDHQPAEARSLVPIVALCSVHGGTVENDVALHANITTACAESHYDRNLQICTPCLHEYLKGKMFPLGEGDIKQRYPATTVRCWAPGCFMPLTHSDIQQYADSEVFGVYDQALCQRALLKDDQVLQCASSDCRCFTWVDENISTNLQHFRCPECCRETCLECNDLYERHCGRECPVRKKHHSTKTRLVEFASKMRVARKHKCPKCPMRYEKNGGCDHITCGGNIWDEYMYGK